VRRLRKRAAREGLARHAFLNIRMRFSFQSLLGSLSVNPLTSLSIREKETHHITPPTSSPRQCAPLRLKRTTTTTLLYLPSALRGGWRRPASAETARGLELIWAHMPRNSCFVVRTREECAGNSDTQTNNATFHSVPPEIQRVHVNATVRGSSVQRREIANSTIYPVNVLE
jgi:hypothetical protein